MCEWRRGGGKEGRGKEKGTGGKGGVLNGRWVAAMAVSSGGDQIPGDVVCLFLTPPPARRTHGSKGVSPLVTSIMPSSTFTLLDGAFVVTSMLTLVADVGTGERMSYNKFFFLPLTKTHCTVM